MLSSHEKSLFYAGLKLLTLCFGADDRAFLVMGSGSKLSPLSSEELPDLSTDSLDKVQEELGALKNPSIVRCFDDIFPHYTRSNHLRNPKCGLEAGGRLRMGKV